MASKRSTARHRNLKDGDMGKHRAGTGLVIRERRIDVGWQVELVEETSTDEGAEPLSWCSVVDVDVRIGQCALPTGGIGGVGTHQAHRRKGYSRRVMDAALELMRREPYALSFLHGIQDFYHKFGYITCMAEHEFALETESLQAAHPASSGLRFRALKRADLPAIARLYNRDNVDRTGSCVRDPKTFGGFPKGTWWSYAADARVAIDGRERIVGYVVCNRVHEHCRVSEVSGRDGATYAAIVGYLARRARRGGHRHVWVNAPGGHPFAIYCRRLGQRLHSYYPRNEKPMGRIMDPTACLEGILPVLANRWGQADRDQILTLRTEIGNLSVGWRAGRLSVLPTKGRGGIRLRQQELTLLLFGYARPSDLSAWNQASIPRDQRPLLERLFPLQDAHMWWTDRF